MDTTLDAPEEAATKTRTKRTAGLVGNRMVLAGVVINLAEFIGIVASGVHTMPLLPDASHGSLLTTYAGQAGVIGFLVGWLSLTSPGRVLAYLGLRRALIDSGKRSSLVDHAVLLMSFTVVLELATYAVCAGTAVAADRHDAATAGVLNAVAHYLEAGFYGPGGLAGALVGWAMWRSGLFPRVLAGLVLVMGAINFLSGTLLAAPSHAALQENLTAINLLGFVTTLWIGILVFLRTPKAVR